MSMQDPGYLFGPSTGLTYEELQQRRKIAQAIASRSAKVPSNLGEGIGHIGRRLAEGLESRWLREDEAAQRERDRQVQAGVPASDVPGMPGAAPSVVPPVPTVPPPGSTTATPAPPPTAAPASPAAAAPSINSGGYQYTGPALPAAWESAIARQPAELQPFLRQTASRETNAGRNLVSPTGAAGPLQFTRGTGRDYGLVTPQGDMRQDADASFDAGTRLAQANARGIQAITGQPATYQQLAIAHQQGLGGFRALYEGRLPPTGNLRVNNLDPASGATAITDRINRFYGFPAGAAPGAPGAGADASGAQRDDMAATIAAQPQAGPQLASAAGPVSDAPPVGAPVGPATRASIAGTLAGIPMPQPRPAGAPGEPPGAAAVPAPAPTQPAPSASPGPVRLAQAAAPATMPPSLLAPTPLGPLTQMNPSPARPIPAPAAPPPTDQGIRPAPPGALMPPAGGGAMPSLEAIPPASAQTMEAPGPAPVAPGLRPLSAAQQYYLRALRSPYVSESVKEQFREAYKVEEQARSALQTQAQEEYKNLRERHERKTDEYAKFQREAPEREIKQLGDRLAIEKTQQELEKMRFEAGTPREQAIVQAAINIKKGQKELDAPVEHVIAGEVWQKFPGTNDYVRAGGPKKEEKLTETQAKTLKFMERATVASSQFGDGAVLAGWQDTAKGRVPAVGNYWVTPEYQRAKSAADAWLLSVLRDESGAVIGVTEIPTFYPQYFPVPGDSPQVIQDKAVRRRNAERSLYDSLGDARPIADKYFEERKGRRTSEPEGKVQTKAGRTRRVIGGHWEYDDGER